MFYWHMLVASRQQQVISASHLILWLYKWILIHFYTIVFMVLQIPTRKEGVEISFSRKFSKSVTSIIEIYLFIPLQKIFFYSLTSIWIYCSTYNNSITNHYCIYYINNTLLNIIHSINNTLLIQISYLNPDLNPVQPLIITKRVGWWWRWFKYKISQKTSRS